MNKKLERIIQDIETEIDEFKDNINSDPDFNYDDSPMEFLRWKEDYTNGPLTILEDIVNVLYN